MSKKNKIILIAGIALSAAAVVLAVFIIFSGGYKIIFEDDFKNDSSFEYGSEHLIPKARVVNRFGVTKSKYTVNYVFTRSDDTFIKSEYPVAPCDKLGKWTVKCISDKASVTKTFEVVDTVAPEIIIGTLPSNVFVGNVETEYSVPAVNFVDSSPIDYNKSSVTLYFNGEKTDYNQLTGAFIPETAGTYVFKIHACDLSGNTSDAECSWRAKDTGWKDNELKDGYLASFDNEGYVNLISSGFINQYWGGSESEEYLESYEGETGVMKITMNYSNWGLSAANIKLARTITPEQLGNKQIVIKYRVDDTKTSGRLTLAGNYVEEQSSAVAKNFYYDVGKWQTAIINASEMSHYFYTDDDGVLRSLQLGMYWNGSGKTSTIYIASITVADRLKMPGNLALDKNTLTWNGVDNADSYLVTVDGKDSIVAASRTSFTGSGTLYQVKAVGDTLFTLDSDTAVYVNDTLPDGYLSGNDKTYYASLVWNNGQDVQGGMPWYESDEFAASYNSNEKAVQLDMQFGYVCAGVVMKFPSDTEISKLDNLVIRVKLDSSVKAVTVFPYGGDDNSTMMKFDNVKQGWNSLVIPKSYIHGSDNSGKLHGLQLAFYSSSERKQGYKQGEKVTVLLGSVTNASRLVSPKNISLSGNTLTWDEISGSAGYSVEEDGKTYQTKDNSYEIKGGALFKITALGDGVLTVDSDATVFVNGTLPEGYLAAFDENYYTYLVWNNGASAAGGMPWYESDSFKSSYNANDKAMDLQLTSGYICAGFVVQFPKQAKLSETGDIAVRIKIDSAVKKITVFPYGGNDYSTMMSFTDLTLGWNTLIIPKSAVHGANSSDETLNGLQFALYTSVDGTAGSGQGTEVNVSIGAISAIKKLAAPTDLKLDGSLLSWKAVSGASGYIIYEDSRAIEVGADTTSYTITTGEVLRVASLGNGVTTQTSDTAMYLNVRVAAGYLAENNRECYSYLVWNNGENADGGMQWYESDSFNAGYDAGNAAIRLDLKKGFVCAGFVEKFAKSVKISSSGDVAIRIWLDENVKSLRIYPYGGTATLLFAKDVKAGWNTLIIPKSSLNGSAENPDTLEGLQFALYLSENPQNGEGQGTDITAYLGSVLFGTKLEKPVLSLNGSTVLWNPVEGASAYAVSVNGGASQTVNSCSFSLAGYKKGVYQVSVTALGNGGTLLDSDAASIKYSNLTILAVPEFSLSDCILNIEPVSDTLGYKIEINGTEYTINAGKTDLAVLTGKMSFIKYRVRALGDYSVTADSDWSDYFTADLSIEKNTLADFDEGYLYAVWNNGKDAPGGMEWYESNKFAASFDTSEKAVKLDMQYGYICAGFVVKFPTSAEISSLNGLVVRIWLDSSVKRLTIYTYGGIANMGIYTDLHEGWNNIIIPKASIYAGMTEGVLDGMQFALYGTKEGTAGATGGQPVTAMLGGIYNGTALAAPNAVLNNNTIEWNAIAGADHYEVYADKKLIYSGKELSCSLESLAIGVHELVVKAVGADASVVSGTSEPIRYSTIAILASPQIVYDDRRLHIYGVVGTAKYLVEINGKVYEIAYAGSTTDFQIVPVTGLSEDTYIRYRVRAIGDGITAESSVWSDYASVDMLLPSGTLADFDAGYTGLVHNNGKDSEGGMEWYESNSFASSYNSEEQSIQLDLTYGYVCAGFVIEFPNAVTVDELSDNIVIRIKLDNTVKAIRIYPYDSTSQLYNSLNGGNSMPHEGWNEIVIPKSMVSKVYSDGTAQLKGLQIVLFASESGLSGDMGGKPTTVYLNSILG